MDSPIASPPQNLFKNLRVYPLKEDQGTHPHKISIRRLSAHEEWPVPLPEQVRHLLQVRFGRLVCCFSTVFLLKVLNRHAKPFLAGVVPVLNGCLVEKVDGDATVTDRSDVLENFGQNISYLGEVWRVEMHRGFWVTFLNGVGNLARIHDPGAVGELHGWDGVRRAIFIRWKAALITKSPPCMRSLVGSSDVPLTEAGPWF